LAGHVILAGRRAAIATVSSFAALACQSQHACVLCYPRSCCCSLVLADSSTRVRTFYL
jgi:hypothetical protein